MASIPLPCCRTMVVNSSWMARWWWTMTVNTVRARSLASTPCVAGSILSMPVTLTTMAVSSGCVSWMPKAVRYRCATCIDSA